MSEGPIQPSTPASEPSDARRIRARIGIFALAIIQVSASYFASRMLLAEHVFWSRFFWFFFLSSTTLYLLFLAFCAFHPSRARFRLPILGLMALAGAISTMVAADTPRGPSVPPESLAGLLHILIVERPALLGFFFLLLGGAALATYYLFRILIPVEYTGTGIQIRLPGQTVHYFPIYPQVSWQNTRIHLHEGDEISVELDGWVSPGALQDIKAWEEYTDRLVTWEEQGTNPEKWPGLPPTWPFEGPAGYPERYYSGGTHLAVLKHHKLYSLPDFYKKDRLLTVQGGTHIQVFGIILPSGQAPRECRRQWNWQAYDIVNNEEHRKQLICLSSQSYPITVEAKQSGLLWVVINDVDEARWDNVGLFFMRVTKHSWR